MVNNNEKQSVLFLYCTGDDVSMFRDITASSISNRMENRWLVRTFVRRCHTGIHSIQHTGRVSDGTEHGTAEIFLGTVDGSAVFWYTFISGGLAGWHKANGKYANYQRHYGVRHIRHAGWNVGAR